ncbi:MAG: AMP-binding protein [Bacteroidales bacterium]|nr:AMP-binding protein [Candidatus Cryptobacteroides equifaecalis]
MERIIVPETLADLYLGATESFADYPVSSYVDGTQSYTYSSFRTQCDKVSRLLSKYGVGHDSKVAIISENMPNWTIAMFACTAFGRVMVPVLPDCSANEVNNILRHSGATAVIASPKQLEKIQCLDSMKLVLDMTDFRCVCHGELPARGAKTNRPEPDDMAAILYTSGTSGNAKGVMLSHRNLCTNIKAAPGIFKVNTEDVFLSVLPMAHTYEMSLGMLYPFACGSCVRYLKAAPTPSVLQKAFRQVNPSVICSVPLIIEKVYRKSILPSIQKSPALSWMQRFMPAVLHMLVGLKMKKTFGGRLRAFAVGGAKLDSEVEAFLKKVRFPYLIGYGMTECAPLICAANVKQTRVGSTGYPIQGIQVKLNNVDPETGMGEIVVKGPNVMMGYYRDPERTRETFTEDGWLRTRDLAFVDSKGRYFISGRLSNMILGASGENIYPEEIEMVINGIEDVEESLVKSENGRLVALVKMYDNALDWDIKDGKVFEEKVALMQKVILRKVNSAVSKASQISRIEFVKEPFEKTATKKIRRFLYC